MDSPKDISQLITVQPESVVSKELVNRPSGTVTLFAFDQGQGLSEHSAPYDALVFVLEGIAEISLSGVKNTVNPNQILLMPAGVPHAVKSVAPLKMLLIMIKS